MHIPRPRPLPAIPPGMTLVELLVALTIAVVLAGLAFNLFGITQSAARSGIQRSSLIQQALAAENRLRNDFANIVGPNQTSHSSAGAIIIVPAVRAGTLPVPGRLGAPVQTMLRSDQLVIFYDAQNGGLLPGTGNGRAMSSLTRTGIKSPQAKIWIGHIQRTNGESTSALDWSLGRQATLLVDPDSTSIVAPSNLEQAATFAASDPRATLSPINTASLSSDVAPFSLAEIANWMRGTGRTDAQMVSAFAVTPNNASAYANQPVVTTKPLDDGVFDASDILGGHRLFLGHVSEVVVQYAADTAGNGLMDTAGATAYDGPVKWYPQDADVFDASSPNHADALRPKVFYPQDDQPRVVHLGYYQGPDATRYLRNRWGDYTSYPAVGGQQFGDALPNQSSYDAAMSAYATHHNGWRPGPAVPPAQSRWPLMIRIRYRLHDPDGAIGSVNEEFAANRRDDNLDGTVDGAAEIRCKGIWFEHVFAIPYPRVN